VMLNDALEPVRPAALDPVHRIAAVGAAERAGVVRLQLRVVRGYEGEALLQILERPAAPVLVDRVGEGLAVAGAAVEIDADRRIAGGAEQPWVPAVGPAVGKAA